MTHELRVRAFGLVLLFVAGWALIALFLYWRAGG